MCRDRGGECAARCDTLVDYSKVDVLGPWYKLVNFGATNSSSLELQINLGGEFVIFGANSSTFDQDGAGVASFEDSLPPPGSQDRIYTYIYMYSDMHIYI